MNNEVGGIGQVSPLCELLGAVVLMQVAYHSHMEMRCAAVVSLYTPVSVYACAFV